jgi:hypothetical protein
MSLSSDNVSFNRSRGANVAIRHAAGNNSERDFLAYNVVNVGAFPPQIVRADTLKQPPEASRLALPHSFEFLNWG